LTLSLAYDLLADDLACEVALDCITVNAICPGPVNAPPLKHFAKAGRKPLRRNGMS
jgi:NAD(P)-dependent dehydrogenase (short-subunit alcohol dehydrogenase family)